MTIILSPEDAKFIVEVLEEDDAERSSDFRRSHKIADSIRRQIKHKTITKTENVEDGGGT